MDENVRDSSAPASPAFSSASNASDRAAAGRMRPASVFFLLLAPLTLAAAPSLFFCGLAGVLRLHASRVGTLAFHMPAQTGWDELLALEVYAYEFVSHWNSAATLAATALFVTTLLLPGWRSYFKLALIPYALLLWADFALRWH